MSKEYKDLKSVIGKYNKVIVTGPHGAGNKIMTKIISKDFNLPEVRGEYAWDLNGYDNDYHIHSSRHFEKKAKQPNSLISFHL